ncbi:hypothetical protein HW555_013629 [Spodoptera exigua]|uniref:Uncharacterized protein n=1 Tax=Spodoptera exigua TaxID=7107 RepID=A0A835KXZ0_SPOEX|nr:hypothetical protein HW555_013629 [Spodoptera exigua]
MIYFARDLVSLPPSLAPSRELVIFLASVATRPTSRHACVEQGAHVIIIAQSSASSFEQY